MEIICNVFSRQKQKCKGAHGLKFSLRPRVAVLGPARKTMLHHAFEREMFRVWSTAKWSFAARHFVVVAQLFQVENPYDLRQISFSEPS